MRLHDNLHKRGQLSAYIIDPAWCGKFPTRLPKEQWPIIAHEFTAPNLMTDLGRVRGYEHGLRFNWFAGGTSSTAPTPADKTLHTEVQRFEVVDIVYTVGQIDVFAEIPPDTGNLTWQEWGLFMDDSTRTRGSGTMFSRLLQQYTKNLGDTVLLNYTVTETV